jgi:hypothetical protein
MRTVAHADLHRRSLRSVRGLGRRRSVASIALAGLAATTGVVLAGAHTPAQASVQASRMGPNVLVPPKVPHSGTYLGLDPNYEPGTPIPVQVREFERLTGRPLGIVSFYTSFGVLPSITAMGSVSLVGSIPMVNMKCGAPDPAIVAGQLDGVLRADARALKDYGRPVLFRWFWEMNRPSPGHLACLDGAGGAGYIAAFQHIWTIFQKVGARNVAFVWCPSDAHTASNQYSLTFYPGNRYVDWIGADLYDRPSVSTSFAQQFATFYKRWTAQAPGKPIMLDETGADGSLRQQAWLDQIYAALTRKVPHVLATPFSDVHAVVYVDAVDLYDYILVKGTRGFDEYADLANFKHFKVLGGF